MKNLHRLAGLLLAGVMSIVFVAAAQPAHAAGGFFTIQNFGSGKCLQPNPAGSVDDGTPIVQQARDASAAQNWAPISLGGGNYRFLNQNSGKCLDARGGNTNGTPAQLWTCNSISNERWNVATGIPNALPTQVVSAIGGRCLDVSGGSLQDGARLRPNPRTNPNSAASWPGRAYHFCGCRRRRMLSCRPGGTGCHGMSRPSR